MNNSLSQQNIANLLQNVEEISTKFNNNIVFQNPFEILRVEISEIIFDFLEMKTLLTFRLSSKSGNELILLLFQKKVNKLQNKKEKLQQEFEDYKLERQTALNSQGLNQMLEQLHKNEVVVQSLNLQDICELKAYRSPPYAVFKTLELLTILLNYTKQVSWDKSKQLISNPRAIMRELIDYDFTSITDKKLEQLQEIYQIPPESILMQMKGVRAFYQYILSIVKLRESNLMSMLIVKQNRTAQLIRQINESIYGLQKILR